MFIDGCYGGESGVIYIDGIYGAIDLETPKISIEKPKIKHTYLFNREFSSFLPRIPGIQEAASRIIGPIDIIVNAEKTDTVEFYLDGNLVKTISNPPYTWKLNTLPGLHTIETIASNNHGISKDIIDVFILI